MAQSFDFQLGALGTLYDLTAKSDMVADIIKHDLNFTQSMFKYNGLPKTIKDRTLEKNMQINGWVCVTSVNGELYAFNCSLGGEPNPDYLPTIAVVSNPSLKYSASLKIGEECVIIPNDSYYIGLMPQLRKYATQEVENTISLYLADINARVQTFLSAQDEDTRKSAEIYLSNLVKGKLGVIAESTFIEDAIKVNPNGNNIGGAITNLIELQQYIESKKYQFLGLSAQWNGKREALNDSEISADKQLLLPYIDNMLEMRKRGVEEINELYGTNISVEFNSVWKRNEEQEALELEMLENEVEATDPTNEEMSEETKESEGTEDVKEENIN